MSLVTEIAALDAVLDEYTANTGLEGFNPAEITTTIIKRVDRTIAAVKDTYRNITSFDFTRPEVINVSQVRNALNRVKYLELEEAMVNAPVSFNAHDHNVLEYTLAQADFLNTMIEHYKTIQMEMEGILGKYVSEPELFSEEPLPEWLERFNGDSEQALPSVDALKEFFDGSRQSVFPFTELYERSSDCVTTCTHVNQLNQKRHTQLNPKSVQAKVKRINQITTEVMKKVSTSKDVRGDTVQFLMNVVLFIALWVRQYANMVTLQLDLTASLKTTEKKLLAI